MGSGDFSEVYKQAPSIVTSGYVDPDGKEVVADWWCVESCPVRQLGEQSGERRSSQGGGHRQDGDSVFGMGRDNGRSQQYYDKGTCARYFFQADWTAERIEQAAPVYYQAKASRRERDAGLEKVEPQLTTNADKWVTNDRRSGTARQPTEWKQGPVRNPHPTCKPIALAKHLATLLLPPPEYAPRRILVPFCGSGSEMIGAMLAGWEEIVGIDIVPDYCDIAEARLAWWADWLAYTGVDDVKELLRLSNNGKVRREKEAERLV